MGGPIPDPKSLRPKPNFPIFPPSMPRIWKNDWLFLAGKLYVQLPSVLFELQIAKPIGLHNIHKIDRSATIVFAHERPDRNMPKGRLVTVTRSNRHSAQAITEIIPSTVIVNHTVPMESSAHARRIVAMGTDHTNQFRHRHRFLLFCNRRKNLI